MTTWLTALLVLCGLSANSHAQTSDVADRLHSPDYLLMMRHTRAPGVGDPSEFKLGDCKTQRNLSDEGIAQAVRIGQWLKQQGVKEAEVYASPWCRTIDTARLLSVGSVTSENTLASTFDEKNTAVSVIDDVAAFVAQKMKNKGSKTLILVTHQVNILAYSGVDTAAGEMVLIRVDQNGKMLSRTVYPRPD